MSMRIPVFVKAMLACVLALAPFAIGHSPVSSAPVWAPAATATITPGSQTVTTGSGQCTSNFIYTNGTDVFIGQAAHCSSTGDNTQTDGCTTQSLPLGTTVEIEGASHLGTLVYNSWIAMQQSGETNPDLCAYNDLALVKIDPADVAKVNPSVPHWGGPVALDTNGLTAGEDIYSYGNSSLRFGFRPLSPKIGTNNSELGGGWGHDTTMITPGIPGDSGSALLSSDGKAVGILSTLGVGFPSGVSNNWADANHTLTYAQSHGMAGVTLVPGTEAFNRNQLPLAI